ncbi:unannotated protein [freshwater metagenome]|uniref:Unannotated protein n=1 Tax=freshwater metagenome TaxID=449393 RepID=A0A6J7DJX8_9ZZZZ
MRALGSLSELIFPVRCLGCSVLGIEICSSCRTLWSRHIYRTESSFDGRKFPIYSSVKYSAVASKVIMKSKEDALSIADNLIISSLDHALTYFQKEIGSGFLVPIPSRMSASRKRGRKYINRMVEGLGITPLDVLSHSRAVRDQSTLHAADRIKNLDGALFVNPQTQKIFSKSDPAISVIIIDDLVTTGATLSEAARALHAGGFHVLGSVTACLAKPVR